MTTTLQDATAEATRLRIVLERHSARQAAEIERLRGLVKYLTGENDDHIRLALMGNPNVIAAVIERARAALGGKP